ncbi:MAG: 50S ribosomal protein L24 [Nanoarchaeota archaeon]|nr:50S ribosomal protein L24 [Nanoarchaeota archaeon]
MKSEFNKSWNSSKQPRKQVKFRANAPNHIKRTFMGATLDKKLREKYGRRNIEVRKGDEVKVMRGKFKGKLGKVGDVDVKNTRVQIDGLQRSKAGGEKLVTWFHPSNLKIVVLNTSDARRLKKGKKVEKTEEGERKNNTQINTDKHRSSESKKSEEVKVKEKKTEIKKTKVEEKK